MSKKNSPRSERDKVRQAHNDQLAAEKRRSRIITWSVVGVVAAIIAIIVVVTMMSGSRSIPDNGPAPTAATDAGGIFLDAGVPASAGGPAQVDVTSVEGSDPDTASQGATEVPGADESDIIIYADANCVYCAQFETENAEVLSELAAQGHSIEYRLVNYLDNPGTGNYSSRAANAMACVAEQSPELAHDYINAVFTSYNQHQGAGISNDELVELAAEQGSDISECVNDNTYRPFVNYTSANATKTGIRGTPSVWVNGVNYQSADTSEPFATWAPQQLN